MATLWYPGPPASWPPWQPLPASQAVTHLSQRPPSVPLPPTVSVGPETIQGATAKPVSLQDMLQRNSVLEVELRLEGEKNIVLQQNCDFLLQQLRRGDPQSSFRDYRLQEDLAEAHRKIGALKTKVRQERRLRLCRSRTDLIKQPNDLLGENDCSDQYTNLMPALAPTVSSPSVTTYLDDADDIWGSESTTPVNWQNQPFLEKEEETPITRGLGVPAPTRVPARSGNLLISGETDPVGNAKKQTDFVPSLLDKDPEVLVSIAVQAAEPLAAPDLGTQHHDPSLVKQRARGLTEKDTVLTVTETPPSDPVAALPTAKDDHLFVNDSRWAIQSRRPERRVRTPWSAAEPDPRSLQGIEYDNWVMYRPGPQEENVFRTVVATNIPLTTTLSTILKQLQGGIVVSAKPMDTSPITKTLTNSAMIVFLLESAARQFTEKYNNQELSKVLGQDISGEPGTSGIVYTLLSTPTHPMCAEEINLVHNKGHTRHISLHNVTPPISPQELRASMMSCEPQKDDCAIVGITLDDDGTMRIEVSSIRAAKNVFDWLTRNPRFSEATARFEKE